MVYMGEIGSEGRARIGLRSRCANFWLYFIEIAGIFFISLVGCAYEWSTNPQNQCTSPSRGPEYRALSMFMFGYLLPAWNTSRLGWSAQPR